MSDGAWTTITSATTPSYTVTGRQNGSYKYQVQACNASGCSGWKASAAVSVLLPPDWMNTSTVNVGDATIIDPVLTDITDLSTVAVKGKAGVSGGQAIYHIPIDLPPGRNGVQPLVSLSYNSQGGNGILGVGWSLNADSSISRCSATFAQDGFTRSVTFNSSTDRLCLDGQRLIAINGSYGVSNTEYRTEMDSFIKVVQHGNINDSNSSFTVYKSDGSLAIYGASANSRFVPSDLNTVLSWKITQESYSNGTNTIDYEYDNNVVLGESLLSKIYYTGNNNFKGEWSISFGYENRNDISTQYVGKGKIQNIKRINEIGVYNSSNNLVRKYIVEYVYSKVSSRSLVASIQMCTSNNQCTLPTTFNWLDSNYVAEPEILTIGNTEPFYGVNRIHEVIPQGDMNGDGTRDFVGVNTNAEQQNIGGNFQGINYSCYRSLTSFTYSCLEMDIDQDGVNDAFNGYGGYLNIRYSSETGSSNSNYHNTGILYKIPDSADVNHSPSYVNNYDRLLSSSDIDGDGFPDLTIYKVVFDGEDSGKVHIDVYLHNKSNTMPFYDKNNPSRIYDLAVNKGFLGTQYNYAAIESITAIGDIDGNGLDDFVLEKFDDGYKGMPDGKPYKILLNNSKPGQPLFILKDIMPFDHFTPNPKKQMYFHKFIDVNGDGLADLLGWDRGLLTLQLNIGEGEFGNKITLDNGELLSQRSYTHVVNGGFGVAAILDLTIPKYLNAINVQDINNDGKQELIIPGKRLITACAVVRNEKLCGDQLYQAIALNPGDTIYPYNEILINAYLLDDSLYQFDAIYFDETENGTYSARKVTTSFIGTAYESQFIDAFGDGNIDLISTYGSRPLSGLTTGNNLDYSNSDSNLLSIFNHSGAYISRSYGSGNGQTHSDYGPLERLSSAMGPFNQVSTWDYKPLSTGSGSGDQSKTYVTDNLKLGDGYIHFASSMYVVQSFKQNNGQRGENETQYAYKGAMYNLRGRGFTGFNQIWEKDMQRDKTVHSIFKQKFPEVGLLTKQTVSVGSTTVNQVTNTWADNPQHTISGVYHNIQTRSLQQSWDLQGTPLSTQDVQVSASDVDASGNIKKQTQSVTDYIKGQANTYTSVTETDYVPDINNWWLNKFNSIKTSHDIALRNWGDDPVGTMDKVQWQLQTVNTWDGNHKLPTKVTFTASDSSCNRVEETGLNSYGLPLWTKTTGQSSTCSALVARQTSFTYTKDGTTQADDGYLPYKVTNAKGHITTTEYDMGLGLPTKVIAPNNIVTQTQYDGIGRPVQVKQTGSPTRYLRYLLANEGNNPPQDNDNIPVVMTRTSGAGIPETEQYFDGQGRLLRTATQGFDGGYQYQDKYYDALGRLTRESTPYGNGTAADYTEFSDFDALDRPGRRTIPNGRSGGLESLYTYNGLTTDINVEGRLMSRTYGSQGWLYETVDAQNGTNRFAYDSAGRPLVIRDANNSDIKSTYNGFGHKTQVIDPNQGTTVFGYNSVGELDKQTDANGVVQTYVLDVLGRVTSKTTTGGSAPGTFVWDTLKQGLLTSETENGVARTYAYTPALQLAQTTVTVDGVSRTVKHQYDSFYGRPKALEYPNGLTLKYTYNDYGYLEQTSNAASGYLYRQITAMDEAGHITGADLANRVMSESRSYYSEGTMASVEVDGPLGRIHAHYYDGYDDFMNLTSERDGVTGLTKSYHYDSLNRLESYSFSNTNPTFSATVNYAYDKVGNFLKKTDYSANSTTAYRYGGSACGYKPNAVCQLDKLNGTTVSFQYDNRGNLRVGDGLTMTYNAMDKPLSVSGRGATTSFVYGSDNMRAKQSRTVGSTTTTTYYVDKYYEADSDGSWRAYLDDIAVLSYTSQRGHLLQYTLRDRLGSATTLADQNGNIVSQRYFDPFGRTTDLGVNHQLDIQNKNTTLSQLQDLAVTNQNRRGFTDHEHLNEQQLIHMNGRIYDYNLGRFMSVDPFIQSPTSTQSVNPYSYIMNNPLAGTDPTGYFAMFMYREKGAVGPFSVTSSSSKGTGSRSNGASGNSNEKLQTNNIADIGSTKQKQNPSYGNDANFAKGYSSIKGDMSGALSWTGPGQAVDSIKSGIEGVETALEEYDRTGSLAGAAWAGTVFALEKYVEYKLKIGRGPDVTNTAEAAADAARLTGKKSGAAAELRVGDKTFTGVSGEIVSHNPDVTGALMGTSASARKPWHGGCAEIVCLDKAMNAGVDPSGGTMRAVNIGISGNGHNTVKEICTSCNDILNFFGVNK
ncbi:SpvB/TcaC N-terminal domain-containing protein [Shewanella sp. NKUCC01_JLK]|uniref:SpvB/TcaC N-terminal domain-containing protein n=1 Tax=Shewanella sp. NKUCC01_JLK TaxID=2842123 RepID=UPI003211C7DA